MRPHLTVGSSKKKIPVSGIISAHLTMMFWKGFIARWKIWKLTWSLRTLQLGKKALRSSLTSSLTLPLKRTLRSICIEFWVVTVVSSPVSLVAARQVRYWKSSKQFESFRLEQPNRRGLHEKTLSHLIRLPYLRGRDNSLTRVVTPPETNSPYSCRWSVKCFQKKYEGNSWGRLPRVPNTIKYEPLERWACC